MSKKLVKRITMEVFIDSETGMVDTRIHEEDFSDSRQGDIKDEALIRERYDVSSSWARYGLVTFSRRKRLYKLLKDSKGENITVVFDGKQYTGVIGGDIARIHGLGQLMNAAVKKGMFLDEQEVELIYNTKEKILTIDMI